MPHLLEIYNPDFEQNQRWFADSDWEQQEACLSD
jgi:hypothetical protein